MQKPDPAPMQDFHIWLYEFRTTGRGGGLFDWAKPWMTNVQLYTRWKEQRLVEKDVLRDVRSGNSIKGVGEQLARLQSREEDEKQRKAREMKKNIRGMETQLKIKHI